MRAGPATRLGVAFDHGDVVAGAGQVAGRRQTAEAGADDHDVGDVIGRA